jgi:hypothetical protein
MNQHAPITPEAIPPHIDPARVIDYDMFGDHRYAEEGSLHDGTGCSGSPKKPGAACSGRHATAGTGSSPTMS